MGKLKQVHTWIQDNTYGDPRIVQINEHGDRVDHIRRPDQLELDLKEICEVRYKPTNFKLFEITGINKAEAIHNAKLTICSLKADWDDLEPNQKTHPYMISVMDMLDDWNDIEFKVAADD